MVAESLTALNRVTGTSFSWSPIGYLYLCHDPMSDHSRPLTSPHEAYAFLREIVDGLEGTLVWMEADIARNQSVDGSSTTRNGT